MTPTDIAKQIIHATSGSAKRSAEAAELIRLYRAECLEAAAQVADSFKCGGCGMDGKAGEAIRLLAKTPAY